MAKAKHANAEFASSKNAKANCVESSILGFNGMFFEILRTPLQWHVFIKKCQTAQLSGQALPGLACG